MLTSVRRIVTGHNQDGKSVVLFDTQAGSVLETAPGRGLTDLWVTDETPAQNAGGADAADRPIRLEPPAGASVFRFFQVAPMGAGEELDAKERERRAEAAFAAMGAAHVRVDTARHPTMHKTATVDYIRASSLVASGRHLERCCQQHRFPPGARSFKRRGQESAVSGARTGCYPGIPIQRTSVFSDSRYSWRPAKI